MCIRVLWLVLALAGLGLSLAGSPAQAQTDSGVVQFYFFYSADCGTCQAINDEFLLPLLAQYSSQVEVTWREISDPAAMQQLIDLEQQFGVAPEQTGIPEIFIGNKVLIGDAEIRSQLQNLIKEFLAAGGVDLPDTAATGASVMTTAPTTGIPNPVTNQAGKPLVRFALFYRESCPHCHEVMQDYLPDVYEKYGDQLERREIEINQGDNYQTMLGILVRLGVPQENQGYVPTLVIGDQVLIGGDEIPAKLEGLIDRYLALGGVDYQSLGNLPKMVPPTPVSSPDSIEAPQPIYMAYFEKIGCQECARTTYDLNLVQKTYPQLVVERFSIESEQAFNKWLAEKYRVPQEKWLSTPMIFVGSDVLIGSEANAQNLLNTVAKYVPAGAPNTWADFSQQDEQRATGDLQDIFVTWGGWKIAGAGLVDGLNPCAFATLIFFISYMAFTGRRGREILLVGMAFALGIFGAYLLIGIGLSKVIQSIPGFSLWGRWVYLLTGLMCIVLAALTIRDFFRARQGQASEMTLKLPMRLRRQVNRVIRKGAQLRTFVPVAFFTGLVVSIIELACTGQIYAPTIIMMLSVPEMASRAYLFLLIYCTAFVFPLVVVFVLSYLGTTSEQLGQFLGRHTATVKALTAAVFAGLALWMVWTMAPLFGVRSPWNWILLPVVLTAIGAGVLATRPWLQPVPKGRRRPATGQAQRRSRT